MVYADTLDIKKKRDFHCVHYILKPCITTAPECKYISNFMLASYCKMLIELISWSCVTNK